MRPCSAQVAESAAISHTAALVASLHLNLAGGKVDFLWYLAILGEHTWER